ncbi:unnamed protein product [Ectocarpus sp. 8 AP-2014]
MWGRVWVLPLCTVIVAIFIAPSASGASCTCGGPTSDAPVTTDIDVEECGADLAGPDLCPVGMSCVCNLSPEVSVSNLLAVIAGTESAVIEWYCEHDGADGHCSQCLSDADCTTDERPICCPETGLCSIRDTDTGACGDPHMTGFLGQKFDFVGQDGQWYSVLSDMPSLEVNMRVTTPVPSLPEITYITGIGIKTHDSNGLDHTIVITVTDPHSLDSACPVGGSTCLADGALTVELDGEVTLLSPGEVQLGPNVAISAVNLPGACRSFGFEKYWERKKEEYARAGRLLSSRTKMQQMSDWILGDPTATNMAECTEYVIKATEDGPTGLFKHDSEHVSFQIMTPKGKLRLSHGRLHQLAMRDPTDRFDLPDHLTWQMNLAFDNVDISPQATGILGETQVPTYDVDGNPIMQGMSAIRGLEDDYLVEGPVETEFAAAYVHA